MVSQQIAFFLKMLKYVGITLAVILLIAMIRQIVWIFDVLHYLNPVIGYLFIAILSGGILYAGLRFGRALIALPKALIAPRESVKNYHVKRRNYLIKYCTRLLESQHLDSSYALERRNVLGGLTKASDSDIANLNQQIIDEVIVPTHLILSRKAEDGIRLAVRDTILSVTLSPFRSLDSIIVFSRSLSLFLGTIGVFNQRPSVSEIVSYFKDVMNIVVNVNLLSYTDQFTKYVFSSVPVLDRTADDLIQGTGAGILVTSLGRATLQRMKSYERWDSTVEKEKFAKTLTSFATYIREIVSDDLVPSMSTRLKRTWEKIRTRFGGTHNAH